MSIGKKNWLVGFITVGLTSAAAQAIPILNHSFESPTVTLAQVASPFVDDWQLDGPVKLEFPPGSGFFVNTNTGIFPNTPSDSPDHIDNVDGNQAAFIGAAGGNEFVQFLAANFEAGASYRLAVAVGKSFGQPPSADNSLRLALFYKDGENLRHFVASRDVFNNADAGLNANHLNDFSADSPVLGSDDPAVGQAIGVLLITDGPVGGFFDMDNVRLISIPEPASMGLLAAGIMVLAARRRRVA